MAKLHITTKAARAEESAQLWGEQRPAWTWNVIQIGQEEPLQVLVLAADLEQLGTGVPVLSCNVSWPTPCAPALFPSRINVSVLEEWRVHT